MNTGESSNDLLLTYVAPTHTPTPGARTSATFWSSKLFPSLWNRDFLFLSGKLQSEFNA